MLCVIARRPCAAAISKTFRILWLGRSPRFARDDKVTILIAFTLVYDLNGTLMKKIRKEYNPVPVPKELKERVLQVFERSDLEQLNVKEKVFFPDHMPPYQYFFTDDIGRLFVMTFEKGEGPRDYMYDIYDPHGVFIGRTSLGNSGNELTEIWGGPFEVRAKNGRLYCMRAKDSGYQELVIYTMNWEE